MRCRAYCRAHGIWEDTDSNIPKLSVLSWSGFLTNLTHTVYHVCRKFVQSESHLKFWHQNCAKHKNVRHRTGTLITEYEYHKCENIPVRNKLMNFTSVDTMKWDFLDLVNV